MILSLDHDGNAATRRCRAIRLLTPKNGSTMYSASQRKKASSPSQAHPRGPEPCSIIHL